MTQLLGMFLQIRQHQGVKAHVLPYTRVLFVRPALFIAATAVVSPVVFVPVGGAGLLKEHQPVRPLATNGR